MNPFKKGKEVKEEKKQDKLEDLMSRHNLESLSQEDKEKVNSIFKSLNYTPLTVTSDKADNINLNQNQAIIDQNFLIIKLLNEISNKLDK